MIEYLHLLLVTVKWGRITSGSIRKSNTFSKNAVHAELEHLFEYKATRFILTNF